jgi:lysophospholipase L1-like esterase
MEYRNSVSRLCKRRALISYMVLIHLCLFGVIANSNILKSTSRPEITQFYRSMVKHHLRMEGNIPDGAVVFIGDSTVQGLQVSSVCHQAVNFGIGGDTTVGILKRLPKYDCLQRASACVIAVGVNDLMFRENNAIIANYRAILRSLPSGLPVVVSAVLPIDENAEHNFSGFNSRIKNLNEDIKSICGAMPKCAFVDAGRKLVDSSGNLATEYHVGDGVHLNGPGGKIWIGELRGAVLTQKEVF